MKKIIKKVFALLTALTMIASMTTMICQAASVQDDESYPVMPVWKDEEEIEDYNRN